MQESICNTMPFYSFLPNNDFNPSINTNTMQNTTNENILPFITPIDV